MFVAAVAVAAAVTAARPPAGLPSLAATPPPPSGRFDPWGHIHEHWCDGDQVNEDHEHRAWMPGEAVGAGDQWGPTREESTVMNLFGPDQAPYFDELPEEEQHALLSRDLAELGHIDIVKDALAMAGSPAMTSKI